MTVHPVAPPRVWHLPHADPLAEGAIRRVLLGRQGIFSHGPGKLRGFELLFRAPDRAGLRIDLWNARQQDRATEHVLAAAFFCGPDVSEGLPLFVNFTRSYLVESRGLPARARTKSFSKSSSPRTPTLPSSTGWPN